jgi:hypothetical protein
MLFGYPLGTMLYTVEFGDGSDALLPALSGSLVYTMPVSEDLFPPGTCQHRAVRVNRPADDLPSHPRMFR